MKGSGAHMVLWAKWWNSPAMDRIPRFIVPAHFDEPAVAGWLRQDAALSNDCGYALSAGGSEGDSGIGRKKVRFLC